VGAGVAERDPADVHEHAHGHAHDHAHPEHHHHHADDDESGEPQSTGFLPISLAVSLFVTGLFVLGIIRC
jgi:hypothetical protein